MQEIEKTGNFQIARRWDIYLNGKYGLKEWVVGLLLSWRNIPSFARDAGYAAYDLLWEVVPLVLAVCGPLLVIAAPVLAIFTARKEVSQEEIRARLRRGFHMNGRAE